MGYAESVSPFLHLYKNFPTYIGQVLTVKEG